MWEFIKHWNYTDNKTGMKMVNYDDMLYPQYDYKLIPNSSKYIAQNSEIYFVDEDTTFEIKEDKSFFIDEKHAKSALAMAQISQLMPYYGGAITNKEWGDRNVIKYTIIRSLNEVAFKKANWDYNFLSFHTDDESVLFYLNNKQLVKDYLMIE